MRITLSRKSIRENITGRPRKLCLECNLFFDPVPLAADPHATHYALFMPKSDEDVGQWIEGIRKRDENIWGYIMDEHGTRSRPFCPPDFTVELTD